MGIDEKADTGRREGEGRVQGLIEPTVGLAIFLGPVGSSPAGPRVASPLMLTPNIASPSQLPKAGTLRTAWSRAASVDDGAFVGLAEYKTVSANFALTVLLDLGHHDRLLGALPRGARRW
jgi:hypothetical protein